MNAERRLMTLILALVMLLTTACGQAAAPNTTQVKPTEAMAQPMATVVPPTATAVPPTPTAVPPTPTPMPPLEPGMGIPEASGAWQISLVGVRTLENTKIGSGQAETTFTPNEGFAFLVLDIVIRSLDTTKAASLSNKNFAILDANKSIKTANGGGWDKTSLCAGCVLSLTKAVDGNGFFASAFAQVDGQFSVNFSSIANDEPVSFVFVVTEEELNQEWQLQFQDIPPLTFKLGDKATYPVKTEVSALDSTLPQECQGTSLQQAQTNTGLVFEEWTSDGLVTKFGLPTGDDPVELCKGLAYSKLSFSPDGGLLLQAGAGRGWASLYVVEPDGSVKSLVRNGLDIRADFIPGTTYAVVSTSKVGQEGKSVYTYDRETGELALLYEAPYLYYTVFGNGSLKVYGNLNSTSSWDTVMGPVGKGKLPELKLPDGVGDDAITPDGKHLIYISNADPTSALVVSDSDGSNPKEVLKGDTVTYADWSISPDGSTLLMPEDGAAENTRHAVIFDIATGTSLPISKDSNELDYKFSADGKWAVVVSTFKREESDKTKTKKQTLTLFNMDSKKVAMEAEGEFVNSFFSPNGEFFAYTIKNEDESIDIININLADSSEQTFPQVLLSGWSAGK